MFRRRRVLVVQVLVVQVLVVVVRAVPAGGPAAARAGLQAEGLRVGRGARRARDLPAALSAKDTVKQSGRITRSAMFCVPAFVSAP
jgi:hypothetical protein